jgi:hypothetical protein
MRWLLSQSGKSLRNRLFLPAPQRLVSQIANLPERLNAASKLLFSCDFCHCL